MPIPFLFIGVATLTGAVGAGKAIHAGVQNSDAKRINESANRRIENAQEKLNNERASSGVALEKLGEIKLNILDNSVREFLDLFTLIKNVDLTSSSGFNEANNLHIDKGSFEDLKELKNFASSLLGGTAFGAYSAATTLATASTGTAIASLSGVAASNATLAFFGGGSLAAGGLGMAGGTAVLGGLVAGPALMVMGFIAGAKASKNLDEAYSNSARSREIAEGLEAGTLLCSSIKQRSYTFYNILARLDSYFLPLIYKMEKVIEKEGKDYRSYSLESQNIIAASASIATTIKAVLDTAILTENGDLTVESKQLANDISSELNEKDNHLVE